MGFEVNFCKCCFELFCLSGDSRELSSVFVLEVVDTLMYHGIFYVA